MANVNFFSPDGGTTRYPIEDTEARSRIAGQQSLVKDTVGWTGKNRAYSQTNNAVIAHIENGITYDVSWTGSATVTLKKNSTSGATITSGSTSPLSFTADADYELYFGSSATVTNIMVKDSRITDPTYEPYHESVQNQLNAQGVLGAKNLLPYPYVDYTKTVDSVTFTDNGDGSISLSGTALANPEFRITPDIADNRYKGMILTSQGGSSTASGAYIRLRVGDKSSGSFIREVVGSKIVIPEMASNEKYYIAIRVIQGTDTSGIRIYPMLRLASDPDDTYQPYAMTNRELTDAVTPTKLSSSYNLDDFRGIDKVGTYYWVATHPTNSPEDKNYSAMQVLYAGGTTKQIVYWGSNNIYMREYNGTSWLSWYKFAGTVVS